MAEANEAIWIQEATRRRRIALWVLAVSLVGLALFTATWAVVTQPIVAGRGPGVVVPEADPARLEALVRAITGEYSPRSAAFPRVLGRLAARIRTEFEQAHGVVEEQPFRISGSEYRNVIARFGPMGPRRIVVGAHYDSADGQPGADDNASGVAGQLELARLLGGAKLDTCVELVAFALEEPPHFGTAQMGSAIHAQSLKSRNADVTLMVSLEMIGRFHDEPGSQRFPLPLMGLFCPSRGNFITVVGKLGQGGAVRRVKGPMRAASALPVYSFNGPAFMPAVSLSDHINYWHAGYDAVMVTDTGFFRNRQYHTPHDTPEKLDYRRMAMVVRGVCAAVVSMSKK